MIGDTAPVVLESRGPYGRQATDCSLPTPASTNQSNNGSSATIPAIDIYFANIRGLSSNLVPVEGFLESTRPGLLFLTECQISPRSLSSLYQISGYNLYSKFRVKKGVCVYAHESLSTRHLPHLQDQRFDVLWLQLTCTTQTFFLCCLYHSPNSPDHAQLYQYLTTTYEHLLRTHSKAEVLFFGDFNVHHQTWLGSTHTDPRGEEAHSFALINNLSQIISQPTRIPDIHNHQPNILDLFLTSNPHNYTHFILPPLGSSDHNLIRIAIQEPRPPCSTPTTRTIWHYDRAQWANLRDFYRDFPWQDACFRSYSESGGLDPNDAASEISEIIHAGMEAYVPHTTKKLTKNSWFNNECQLAINTRNRAYSNWKHSLSELSHAAYITARNQTKSLLRRTKSQYIRVKCSAMADSNNPKHIWSLTKNITNNFSSTSIPPLHTPDGITATSPLEKANIMAKNFAKNANLDDTGHNHPAPLPLSHPMGHIIFSYTKVYKILSKLDVTKAYGPDGIPPRVLKECAAELSNVLARLFKLCIKTSIFPAQWKHALVQPIPKKGDRSNPNNYRPISITSAISKVFETIINEHILNHVESFNLLCDRQYGFRKARSTGDILSYLTSLWASTMRDFGESFIVALDISKAFDRVWHPALLSKLPHFGFPPSLCSFIENYLSGRSLSVVVNGSASDRCTFNSGVPQGCVLSPTLFLIFLNDLLEITSEKLHSYADDSTLHASSSFTRPPGLGVRRASRVDIASRLSNDLSLICDWGERNLVRFNEQKTQLQALSLSTDREFPLIHFQDTALQYSNEVNILGLTIDAGMTWKTHIQNLTQAASAKIAILFRCRPFFSSSDLLRIYKGLIRPCMEYCSHIWSGSAHVWLLDRIENKVKRLINDPGITDQLCSLSVRRKVSAISLFYKYYFGHCSAELRHIIPRSRFWGRDTRAFRASHRYCVDPGNCRLDRFGRSFVFHTSHMWNDLPPSVFPSVYNLSLFKTRIYRHLNRNSAGN